jgi:arylsulfatase A
MLVGRWLFLGCLSVGLLVGWGMLGLANDRPNVLLILADDLGYGDVHCYNPDRGKIATPHLDALAAYGMRFTDAHTSSGVCSPTRYALLTGRHHWRTKLQTGIVQYLEGPLIAPDRLTIADFLKERGYQTSMVGKWHLGWNWNFTADEKQLFAPEKGKKTEVTGAHRAAWDRVYSSAVTGGPLDCGFEQYFGTDVPNWPPYSFFEGNRLTKIPDTFLPATKLERLQASIPGPAVTDWKLEEILPALGTRASQIVRDAAKKPDPFFLYLPLTSPHTPIAVTEEWKGKSQLNGYADFVMETDAIVGQVLDALRAGGAEDNTIVIFTSDNGCSPLANFEELQQKGHFPSGPLRGKKADAWEGGHRVPFIVRWPGKVMAGSRCDGFVQQSDVFSTLAEILGDQPTPGMANDSLSFLSLLRGSAARVREAGVSCGSSGLPAFRRRDWKIIFGPGNGGSGAASKTKEKIPGQLYDLATDLGETKNIWLEKPELVADMTAAMELYVNSQPNDVPVQWKRFLK